MAIARQKNIPYIVIPHGLLCEWSLQQKTQRKQIYLKLIEQVNIENSDAIHFTSQKEQQEFEKLGLNVPSFVLPLGTSLPKLIPHAHSHLCEYLKVPVNEPVILFMSRLHPKKGLDYLIPALAKLIHHRFTFVIAGSGSQKYEAEIKSLVISNGIRDRTYFAGFLEGEIKNLFMQGSDLFVLTSHSENFAVVVLEALAVGIPVVVTPGIALADIVEQHQLGYVTPLDVDAIASTLEKYLCNPQQAQDMGNSGRQLVSDQYTWKQITLKMQQVYADLAKN